MPLSGMLARKLPVVVDDNWKGAGDFDGRKRKEAVGELCRVGSSGEVYLQKKEGTRIHVEECQCGIQVSGMDGCMAGASSMD